MAPTTSPKTWSRRWTPRASVLALAIALWSAGCGTGSPLIYVDLDAVPRATIEAPNPRSVSVPPFPSRAEVALPPVDALDAEFLDVREAMQGRIEAYLGEIRDAESERRREMVRIATTERMAAERRAAVRAYEAFAVDSFASAMDRLRERLVAYGEEVGPLLVQTVNVGYHPEPEVWGEAPPNPVAKERYETARRLWGEIREARRRYDRDADAIIALHYEESDAFLTERLAEIESRRELQDRQVDLMGDLATAETIRGRADALGAAPPPNRATRPAPAVATPPPPGTRAIPRDEDWTQTRERLREEAALFAKLRGGRLSDRPAGAQDLTEAFVAWRSGRE